MSPKPKHIVITGGAGFVGARCALYYAKKRFKVTVVDNFFREKLTGIKSCSYHWGKLAQYKNIKRIKGDIRKKTIIKEILKKSGADIIIHTAAQPGVTFSIKNPYEDFSINIGGTINVLEGMRRWAPSAKLIYCSTNKVYGENINNVKIQEKGNRYNYISIKGISEEFPTDSACHTPYGVSKYSADLYVREYAHMYNLRTAVFRMSCIYGEGQFGAEEQGWISHFVIRTLLKKPITVYGNGKQVRDILYIDDLIRAFDLYACSNIQAGFYNIGGGRNNSVSINEALSLLKRKIGHSPEIKYAPPRPGDQLVYITDISKVQAELGWKPYVNVEDGIDKLIRWTQKNLKIFK